MKGRGEIIAILCMSVFLICILYAMTYGGIVKAEELEKQPEEAGEKTEVDIEEELRWAEEVKKILKDIVGIERRVDPNQDIPVHQIRIAFIQLLKGDYFAFPNRIDKLKIRNSHKFDRFIRGKQGYKIYKRQFFNNLIKSVLIS